MELSDLTNRSAVLHAIAEFDQLGRESFLAKYGFGPARSYFLVHNGKRYDSKAIAGVAVGKQFPASGALTHSDFSGGEATVQAKLESLGFHVASNEPSEPTSPPVAPSPRNANWNRDELILALDLYVKFAGNPPGKASAEVSELSALLNALSTTLASATDYRNHNGVYMKLMNFRRIRPRISGSGEVGPESGKQVGRGGVERVRRRPRASCSHCQRNPCEYTGTERVDPLAFGDVRSRGGPRADASAPS